MLATLFSNLPPSMCFWKGLQFIIVQFTFNTVDCFLHVMWFYVRIDQISTLNCCFYVLQERFLSAAGSTRSLETSSFLQRNSKSNGFKTHLNNLIMYHSVSVKTASCNLFSNHIWRIHFKDVQSSHTKNQQLRERWRIILMWFTAHIFRLCLSST